MSNQPKNSFDYDKKAEQAAFEVSPNDVEVIPEPPHYAALGEDGKVAINRSATKKIDILILPIIWLLYLLNYLDRQNIASARLANLERDLGISDTQYQTCISILFAGYIAFQVPSNLVLGLIKYPAWWIILAVVVWGGISAATGAVQGYVGLLLCRTCLGCVEAVFFPGALYYLTCFYTKKQLAFRTAILYSGSQIGNAVAGLIAIGILKLDGKSGLEGWRWLFIIEGVITVALALLVCPLMPNSPRSALWLTAEEKDVLEYRIKIDRAQKAEPKLSVAQAFKLMLIDPKTWLFMGILTSLYVGTAVTNFFPSVVGTLGYDRTTTYGLTAPPYIIAVFAILFTGWNSDRVGNRFWHCALPLVVFLLGNIIAVSTLNTGARYFAMCLLPGSGYSTAIVMLSWMSGSVTGPRLKRAITISLVNAVANTPNIWTSYLYFGAPRYTVAFGVNTAFVALTFGLVCATRWYLAHQNAKIDAGRPTGKSGPSQDEIDAGFRYPL